MFHSLDYQKELENLPQDPIYQTLDEMNAIWGGEIHDGVRFNADSGYSMHFRFGYRAESGIWKNDATTNGISQTTPIAIYIRNVSEGESEYTRYDLATYKTPDTWRILFKVNGFSPKRGSSYDFVLLIQTNDSPLHNYPNSTVYFKTFTPWTFR